MGTATLELETGGNSLQVGPNDETIQKGVFTLWHTSSEGDAAAVMQKGGRKIYVVKAGETREIVGIGTVTHLE